MNERVNNLPENLDLDLQTTLDQTAEDLGLENLAVGVGIATPDGSWSGASGVSNIETQTPTEADDLFNIASISKSFTSAVILKLQEKGELSLDDTLGQWLPAISAQIPGSEHLTLREILNGTSGIPEYSANEEFLASLAKDYFSGSNREWQPEEIIAFIAGEPLFSGEFSTDIWAYPNTGYIIAGLIAEEATGLPFEQILTEEILEPLELDETFFSTQDVAEDRRVRGYEDIFTVDGEEGHDGILEDYTSLNTSFSFGTGSMVSNAEEVAIFFDALASGELLQPESTAEIFNYVDTGIPQFDRFGMGVFPRTYAWGDVKSMTGGIFGYSSEVDYSIDEDTTVSVLVNQDSAKASLTGFAYKAAIAKTLGWGNIVYSAEEIVNDNTDLDTPLEQTPIDILVGTQNNDFLAGDCAASRRHRFDNLVFGEAGNDVLEGRNGDDFLNGGRGGDRLEGGNGQDSLIGGYGEDALNGNAGNDILDGGYGADTLEDLQGDNTLYGNQGNDSLLSGRGDDLLYGEGGSDRLISRGGNDVLFGGYGHDYLNGGGGDDELIGGIGRDTLVGGSGINILSGGNSSDRFVLSFAGTSLITDFNPNQDVIRLPDDISYDDLEFNQWEEDGTIYTAVDFQDETLAILNNINAEAISGSNFIVSQNTDSLFIFNFANNVPQEVRDGVEEAGEIWSSYLTDEVKINIKIDYDSLGEFTAGEADSNTIEVPYGNFYQALNNDATSANDAIALESLPDGESINLLINNTQENQGIDEAYLDNNGSENNSTIRLTNANAKALGLEAAGIDATITFNSDVDNRDDVSWDFDRTDGIDDNAIDFQTIATHEIGHTLGFTSGVDDLNITAGQNLQELITNQDTNLQDVAEILGIEDLVAELGLTDVFADTSLRELIADSPIEPLLVNIQPDTLISENEYLPTAMDLFRYSSYSSNLGVIDFTTGETAKYFSLDGGQTEIAQLSTGVYLGDGGQISHWKHSEGIGIMQPGSGLGTITNISSNDLQLLDVIGWETIIDNIS